MRFQSRSGRWLVRSLQSKLQTNSAASGFRTGNPPAPKARLAPSIRKLIEREVANDLARLDDCAKRPPLTRCNLPIRTGKLVRLTTRSSTTFGCHAPWLLRPAARLVRCCAARVPDASPAAGGLLTRSLIFFSLGGELNIAIIDGTSRARRCLLAAGRLSCRKALGQTVRIAVIASQKSASCLWQTWRQRTL